MDSAARTSSTGMRFSVLGPLRAWRGDEELDLGPRQQRLVLAVLLVRAGQPVPLSELVDALWDEDAPSSAVNVVHRHVGQLRRVLEPDLPLRATGRWLVRDGSGYRLLVDADSTDVLRFRALVVRAAEAAARGGNAEAVAVYVAALRLWRGPCALGLRPSSWADPTFTAVDRECLSAATDAADAALACGLARDVLPTVRAVAARDPLNEELHARLVLLLSASGHQAEALAEYRSTAARLAAELGVDPGPALRDAQRRVLRQQVPIGAPAEAEPPVVRPAQLPRDLSTFSGRDGDLTRMLTALDAADLPMTIALIDGMPGAGKTTVAVRLAYEVANRYPDGQLFVNLRGFDPGGSAVEPAEVLRGFLYALGAPGDRVPADLAEQTGLYRALLRDKRMLVVLDNARDVRQVLPLLPDSPHCLVIATSRNRLTDLVTDEGAHPFTLDPMPVPEARAMVALRLGVARSAREPEAVDRIVAMCGRLPLALAVVAARAATYPDVPLSSIAKELEDAQGSLDAFGFDDTSDLRAVFSWSYRTLTPGSARVFRMLALHWGPDISLAAGASLLGVPPREARAGLAELTRTRLMTEHKPGRYQFHDLVRAYALELGAELDSADERREAESRLLDHLLHSANNIHLLLRGPRPPVPLDDPLPGVTPETARDYDDALAWFGAERHVVESSVATAITHGAPAKACQLALTMQQFYQRHGLHHSWSVVMELGLKAAREAGDRYGEVRAQRSLAGAYYYLADNQRALALLREAEPLIEELGWDSERPYVQRNIADVLSYTGPSGIADYPTALEYYQNALEGHRAMANDHGMALSIEGIGECKLRLGQPEAAIALLTRSAALYREIGDRNGTASSFATLGEAHLVLGRPEIAATHLMAALVLHRGVHERRGEVNDLVLLGDARAALQDLDTARAAWEEALAIMVEHHLTWAGPTGGTPAEIRDRIEGHPSHTP
ncbi:AfsR/SARP family transcriptional regulator [Umezawaea tangerina]|nr:BTAD domain-containing putative transcriptional regulator [Umezawaea tangerina]